MEIAPGVFDLTPPTRGYLKGGYVHAFLIVHGSELILIDTLYDPDAKVILDQVQQLGKNVRDIKHIILTHAHRAHLGGLAKIKELTGAPVYSHAWEADIVAGERKQQGISIRPMKGIQVWPIVFLGSLLGPIATNHIPCPVDHLIGEGDKIGPVRVIYTPGHTPGHLAFYLPEQRAVFTGDAFVTWPMICPGWPNAMLNEKQTWQSLHRLAELDVEVVGGGHGGPITKDGGKVLRDLAARGTV